MLRILLFSFCAIAVQSANILGYFLTPSYSHQITFQPIWRELSLRGHKVTVITPNPLKDESLVNLTEIDISEPSRRIWKQSGIATLGTRKAADSGQFKVFFTVLLELMNAQMSEPRFQEIIQKAHNETFDLVLVEYLSVTSYPLKDIYGCPLVGISSMPLTIIGQDAIGNPSHPVIYPDLNLPFIENLTFFERLQSVLFSIFARTFASTYVGPINDLLKKYYGNSAKSFTELFYRVDLVLANINPILNTARPNVPSIVEFSGIHMKPQRKLPEDLDYLLRNESVIYMSFGSNIESSLFPDDKIEIILDTVAELPYKVLWKFEDEHLPNKPHNLVIRKWFPQQDVLRHRNVKLFITQGGLQSLDEAMYTKTPVVVVPFFGDQIPNSRKVEKVGFGRSINFIHLNKADFKRTILDVLTPKYETRAEELYNILNDQPMGSLEKAIWWIEYVIRHQGAPHLRSSALNVPWYLCCYLDIIAFFVASIIACNYIIKLVRFYCATKDKQD